MRGEVLRLGRSWVEMVYCNTRSRDNSEGVARSTSDVYNC